MNPLPVSLDRAGLKPVEQPEIGIRYWVSFAKLLAPRNWPSRWRPIIGPLHTDAEIIGFPHEHWHIDWRFADSRLWEFVTERGVERANALPCTRRYHDMTHLNTDGMIYRRRVLCRRAMPPYMHPERIPWLAELERTMKGRRMKCFTCPHRAMPLDPRTAVDGVIQCAAHGLSWNVATGKLVKRARAKQAPERSVPA